MIHSEPSFFYARGKLLLCGEYFVLDGAKAIGLPSKFGQSLMIKSTNKSEVIHWKSITSLGECWFEATFRLPNLEIIHSTDLPTGKALSNILIQARRLNPGFLIDSLGLEVESKLEFPRLWGLGSSSTLLYNMAQWSAVDAFELSANTFGGSGYDIACAGADKAISYQLKNGKPQFEEILFAPDFCDRLFFIYLSKKQNSRSAIKRYRHKAKNTPALVSEVSRLSDEFLQAQNLKEFQKAIRLHEEIVSNTIEMPKVQDLYFSDFDGAIKSLGAWGGDFVLAATEMDSKEARAYFNKKGFEVFFKYKEMVIC